MELRREFHEFREFMSDYIADIDPEIKGYELASKFTGVSRSTLKELVKQKKITYKKDGRAISFSRKDLVEYKRGRRLGKGHTSEAGSNSH